MNIQLNKNSPNNATPQRRTRRRQTCRASTLKGVSGVSPQVPSTASRKPPGAGKHSDGREGERQGMRRGFRHGADAGVTGIRRAVRACGLSARHGQGGCRRGGGPPRTAWRQTTTPGCVRGHGAALQVPCHRWRPAGVMVRGGSLSSLRRHGAGGLFANVMLRVFLCAGVPLCGRSVAGVMAGCRTGGESPGQSGMMKDASGRAVRGSCREGPPTLLVDVPAVSGRA